MLAADIKIVGDLAFLLHFLGMNPAASTHGNPWIWIDDSGDENVVVWREADEYFLHSHVLPPKESKWWSEVQWPWACECCGDTIHS